mmetsp:Transcript_36961/g.86029  ORF Transcript_36961/g.86029 Transcript_36961/m.86029 type:complete len:83 (-) Transcript_36961:1240-1488(-)
MPLAPTADRCGRRAASVCGCGHRRVGGGTSWQISAQHSVYTEPGEERLLAAAEPVAHDTGKGRSECSSYDDAGKGEDQEVVA